MDENVAQLLLSTVGATRQYNVDAWLPTIENYRATESVRGQVRLTRTNRGILVGARLTTSVSAECSRCLDETATPVHLRIDEEFLPLIDPETGVPLAIEPGEEAFTIDEHNILNLDEAIRQYTLLELPVQLLCRPDCAGLCPHCGANLNAGACACGQEADDERLTRLAELLRAEAENAAPE